MSMSLYETTVVVSLVMSLVAIGVISAYVITESKSGRIHSGSSDFPLWVTSVGVLSGFAIAIAVQSAGGGVLWVLLFPVVVLVAGALVSNIAISGISKRYGGGTGETEIEWGDTFVDDGFGFYSPNGEKWGSTDGRNDSLSIAMHLPPQ